METQISVTHVIKTYSGTHPDPHVVALATSLSAVKKQGAQLISDPHVAVDEENVDLCLLSPLTYPSGNI
jgi:hypothetical protein